MSKLIQAAGLCYLICLLYCLSMTRQQLIHFFQTYIDIEMGRPFPLQKYAQDCRIFTPENPNSYVANLKEKLDVFIPAHFFGWLVKVLILRDYKLPMIQQLFFEFLEITFLHWIPNFRECWWDQYLMDIIICNTGGIIIGWWIIKKYQLKKYRWSLNFTRKLDFLTNLKYLVFSPHLCRHEWGIFQSSKRLLGVSWFIIFMQLTDLSYFFNKFILWIKPTQFVFQMRIFLIALISFPATKEFYEWISNESNRIGVSCQIMTLIVTFEWILFFKNYQSIYSIILLNIQNR